MPGDRPAGLRPPGDRLRAGGWLVESKSLKLYLSFRNHGAFHEDCTVRIGKDLVGKPHWLRIGGYWFPRGGIPIDVFWQSGQPPKGVWMPDRASRPIAGAANGKSAGRNKAICGAFLRLQGAKRAHPDGARR